MKNTFRIAGLATGVVLALLLNASCDLSGGGSSSGGSQALTAADALRAIPLTREVVGLTSAEASSLHASSLRIGALSGTDPSASWSGLNLEAWDSFCNDEDSEPEYPVSMLCQVYGGTLYEAFQVDMFVEIMRALAEQTDVPLQMGVPNELAGISADVFPDWVWFGEPKPTKPINAGVLRLTENAGGARIAWVLDWLTTEAPDPEPSYYIMIDLKGWPGTITEVEVWYVEDTDEYDYVNDEIRWEYQYGNLSNKQVRKHVVQPARTGEDPEVAKYEDMVWQGVDGGLNGFVGIDEACTDDGEQDDDQCGQLLSYSVRDDYTAIAESRFDTNATVRLTLGDDTGNRSVDQSSIWVFTANRQVAVHETEDGDADAETTVVRPLHGEDLEFIKGPDPPIDDYDSNDHRIQELITASNELQTVWQSTSMPSESSRPSLKEDFPAWPWSAE